MKKLILILSVLILGACSSKEHFISLVKETRQKAVTIEVDTVMEQMQLTFNGIGVDVNITTVPVTVAGAGVFISPVGHVLTCSHLFTQGPINAIRVIDINDQVLKSTLLYISTSSDLGLLKVSTTTSYPYAALAKGSIQIGQEVVAIGDPSNLSLSVSHGIVSSIRPDFYNGHTFIQVDAPTNHGNSGGPLFDLNGRLIGVITLKMNGDGLGFAVIKDDISSFLDLFKGVK